MFANVVSVSNSQQLLIEYGKCTQFTEFLVVFM